MSSIDTVLMPFLDGLMINEYNSRPLDDTPFELLVVLVDVKVVGMGRKACVVENRVAINPNAAARGAIMGG